MNMAGNRIERARCAKTTLAWTPLCCPPPCSSVAGIASASRVALQNDVVFSSWDTCYTWTWAIHGGEPRVALRQLRVSQHHACGGRHIEARIDH